MRTDENILVVPESALPERIRRGEEIGTAGEARALIARLNKEGMVAKRAEAEVDERHKQVIPYVVMTCGGQIFSYVRGHGGGEDRLHDLRSIGVGGHVTTESKNHVANYWFTVDREVSEEVDIRSPIWRKDPIGLVYHAGTSVGRVHVGIVHQWELQSPVIWSREEGKLTRLVWDSAERLAARWAPLESWAQIILQNGMLTWNCG